MSFRYFQDFNEAMLSKQVWRLHIEPTTFVAGVLKSRYYPNYDTPKAKLGRRPSYLWGNIHHNNWIIYKGNCQNIFKGNKINIWEDNWIPKICEFKILTQKLLDTSTIGFKDLIDEENGCWDLNAINNTFISLDKDKITKNPYKTQTKEILLARGIKIWALQCEYWVLLH